MLLEDKSIGIGLDIDRMRCALAAIILQDVLAKATQRFDLALFNTDIKQEGNWVGVSAVFDFWDKVRVILFSSQCINEFCFN